MTTNIEIFNRCAGLILAKLYENFPVPLSFDYLDIPSNLFDDEDTYDSAWDKMDIYKATINWLHQAGYIWASKIGETHFIEAVLSPKGLEVMNVIPAFQTGTESVGQRLLNSVRAGAKDLVQETIKLALTEGLKYLVTKP